jgi:hypothetical protein
MLRTPARVRSCRKVGRGSCWPWRAPATRAPTPARTPTPPPPPGPGATATDDDGTPTTSAGDDTMGDDTGAPAEFDPAPVRLRLLLARHYQNSIRDLLGEPAAALAAPPIDTAINGFEAIAAAQVALTDSAVDVYEKSARAVAAEAMKDTVRIAGLLGCQPTGPDDDACHRSFVTTFGRLIWRRPLATEEIDRYTAVAQDAALQFADFNAGVEAAIFTFLQSPYFLYQVEVGEPDPNAPEERALTSIEMATRLSYFLLDTTPTAELLTIAENGGLGTPDEVRAVAEVMVEAPGARLALGSFYAEVLKLRTIEALAKDPNIYPQFSPALAVAMRQETLALVDDVAFTADSDFRDILDAPYTFVNGPLAALYGLIPDPNADRRSVAALRPPRGGQARRHPRPVRLPRLLLPHLQHLPDPARQVRARGPDVHGHAAPAARRRHQAARGRRIQDDARPPRPAPQRALRRLPRPHGPDRPRPRELRRHRHLPHRRERRRPRHLRDHRDPRRLRRRPRARHPPARQPRRHRVHGPQPLSPRHRTPRAQGRAARPR